MSRTSLAVVILAAGIGSRMKSDRPKVMHELAGKPMISWLVDTAMQLKPGKIIVVTGPDMKNVQQAVHPHLCVIQKIRNGTAGALKIALPALENHIGPVLVLLGDAPLMSKQILQALIKARKGKFGISVLGAKIADPTGYGRLVSDSRQVLQKIVEHKDASVQERMIDVVNTGAFCIDGASLKKWLSKVTNKNASQEYYITDLPAIAARDGVATKIVITQNIAEVQGCNTRADLSQMEQSAQNLLRARAMDQGVTMIDPGSVTLHHDTKISADVIVEPHVFFGPGVTVAPNARIRAFSYLEGVSIGARAVIGPFARLRPGTQIGEDVRVGNFVEIKKSHIGKGAKINHLAYVGDCVMGENTNFSAGAITVNYDGFEKHQTVIGSNVMIGSNVNLVAPVKIEDGAYVAAGSTITKTIISDALAIAREPVKIYEGWAVKHRRKHQD